MVSQVSLGYVGLFFQQSVPAWVFAERSVASKLSAQAGDQGWLCLQQGALLVSPLQAGQSCRQGLFQTTLKG